VKIIWLIHICVLIRGYGRVRVIVFNTTVNNDSVISWLSILLVEGTSVPEEIDMPQVTDKLNNILYQVNSRHEQDSNSC
jgi:hypothetical protein